MHDLQDHTRVLRELTYLAAESPDPRTQNAALLFDPRSDEIFVAGTNHMPIGTLDSTYKWERPGKYERVVHSETGCIARAARFGIKTKGLWLYCCFAACGPCSSLIAESGIAMVITFESSNPDGAYGDAHLGRWGDSTRIGYETLAEANIPVVFISHPVMPDTFHIMRDGKLFRP